MKRHALIPLFLLPWWIAAPLPQPPGDPWKAPPQADQLKDPMAAHPKAVERGAKVFASVCWTCHGPAGQGDGPAAAGLATAPARLSAAEVQAQSNGALYWKITHGRDPMPAYEELLSREERWAVVHYIRTLK